MIQKALWGALVLCCILFAACQNRHVVERPGSPHDSRKAENAASAVSRNQTVVPVTLNKKEREARIRRTMRGIMLRDVDVTGRVVDELGRPLTAVRIWERVFDPRKGESAKTTISANGRFRTRHSQALGVYLYFSKAGYYTRECRFVPGSEYREVPSADGQPGIVEKDLAVKMEAVGPAGFLKKHEIRLTHNLEGQSRAVRLSSIKGYIGAFEQHKNANSLHKFRGWDRKVILWPSRNGEAMPDATISIQGEMRGKSFATIASRLIQPYGKGSTTGYDKGEAPEKVTLEITGEGNGFIPHLVGNHGRFAPLSWREMKAAPARGYRQRIVLSPRKDCREAFWIKLGRAYGKGMMDYRVSKGNPNLLKATLQIRLQPDGTTNLRERDGASPGTFDPVTLKAIDLKVPAKGQDQGSGTILFDINGKVTDPSGKILKGAAMRADINGIDVQVSYPEVNQGGFQVKTQGKRLFLQAGCEGFYPKRVQVEKLLGKRIVEKDGRHVLQVDDLVIALQPMGKVTRLASVSGTLIGHSKRPSRAIHLTISPRFETKGIEFQLAEAANLPLSTIYLAPKQTNGKIALLREDVKLRFRVLKAGASPAAVPLRITGKGNGMVYLGSDELSYRKAMRGMKDAPVNGYTNEITLNPASHCHLFYVKLDKLYGKGTCKLDWKPRDKGREVRATFRIFLQPDGSRNVRTAE